MKSVFVAALAVGALFVLTASAASAAGGPHQSGQFTATTDACAGCHRTHTAAQPGLLMQQATALCRSCHGSTATGANTNVDDGKYVNTRGGSATGVTANNADLLGGGFNTYKGVAATSTHDVSGTNRNAWGYGATTARGTTALITNGLDCGSCHDPHGNPNYRILDTTVNGVAVAVQQVDEGATKDYGNEHWGSGTSQFCATCHTSYHKTAANQARTLDLGNYTHRIDVSYSYGGNVNPQTGWTPAGSATTYRLPLANFGTPTAADDKVVCGTCHMAHGTSAQMTAQSNFGIPTAGSSLLRMDNRGVCEVCHQK